MRRRTLLGTTGATLGVVCAGCLTGPEIERDADNAGENDAGEHDGAREPLDVRLYNYREEAVSVDLLVEADDDELVSEVVDLSAPETVFTDHVAATIPEGTRTVRIAAASTLDGREATATRSFNLPAPDPIEGFEVRIDDGGIGIATLGYDSPA